MIGFLRSWRGRLLTAFLALLSVAVLTPVAAGAVKTAGATAKVWDIVNGSSSEMIFGSCEVRSGDPILADFEEEVLVLEEYGSILAFEEGALVGFSMGEDAESSYQRIKELMEKGGWGYVDSGLSTSGTFSKECGKIRWAFVDCTYVSGQTSVCVRCAP